MVTETRDDELTRLRAEVERLRDYAKNASDALLKVRPLGGSELFIKVGDEFYADPEFCGTGIDEMKAALHESRARTALRISPMPFPTEFTVHVRLIDGEWQADYGVSHGRGESPYKALLRLVAALYRRESDDPA